MVKQTKQVIILAILLAVVIPTVVSAAWWNPFSWGVWNRIFHFQRQEQKQVVCTMDAKLCPDGSSVGRHGPKCEFDLCPGEQACKTDADCPTIYCIKAPCPQNKCTVGKCQPEKLLLDAVYPLFEGAKWTPVTPKKMDILNEGQLSGYGVSGQGEIADQKNSQDFFNYYKDKLTAAGWTDDVNADADGILGGQRGYKKGNDRIVISFTEKPGKVTSKKDEPMQWTCPCKMDYTIFTSSQQNPPVLGGDKDEHGCIGSAGYSWCEAKQKCLRQWEEKCELSK